MTEINAKIIIQDDIADILNISDVELDGQIESWVERNLNIEDEITDWMRSYFDIDDYLRDADLASHVTEVVDVEYDVRNLLENYSPLETCSTGSAFTEAVSKAVRAFLLVDKNVEYIIKAIDRYNKHLMARELATSIRDKHYQEFKKELEDYSRHVNPFSTPTNDIVG